MHMQIPLAHRYIVKLTSLSGLSTLPHDCPGNVHGELDDGTLIIGKLSVVVELSQNAQLKTRSTKNIFCFYSFVKTLVSITKIC